MRTVTYDRKIEAKLMVQLAGVDEPPWEATDDDLGKFGYTDPHAAYERFAEMLTAAVRHHGPYDGPVDAENTRLNSILHLIEVALFNNLDFDENSTRAVYATVGAIEKTLVQHGEELDASIQVALDVLTPQPEAGKHA